eukprot:m.67800 g.67800  ORF g.67800 m.67800 type:complete len:396 (-) comp23871_c0_seq1:51-1238(-)
MTTVRSKLTLAVAVLMVVVDAHFVNPRSPKFDSSSGIVGDTAGCGKTRAVGRTTRYVSVDDPLAGLIQRKYNIYIPKNYDPAIPTPIVYDFHGYYGTAENQEEQSGFQRVAEKYYFIVVWPQGMDDTVLPFQQASSWNAHGVTASPGPLGPTCNWTDAPSNYYPCHKSCRTTRGCRSLVTAAGCDCGTCANDETYVTKMMDDMEKTYCIGTSRVYATGFSMGAMMVYTLAATQGIGERFAAVAPTAGSNLLGFNYPPVKPMPVLDIHGSKDDIIPSNISNGHGEGADGSALSQDGYYYHTTSQVMKVWADTNGCGGTPAQYFTKFDGVTDLYCWSEFGRCPGSLRVIRCTHSNDHTWPFPDTIAGREQYAQLVWEFFAQAIPSPTNHDANVTALL